MAEIVTVKLVAETGDAVKNVEKVEKSVQKTGIASKKASKELSGLEQAGGAVIGKLDRVTGGLASKFVAVGKAAKLSGKAMKTALISSGIGAAVVALSLIVEHWDAISEVLGFVNKDLEKQANQLNKNIALNDEQLKSLDNQEQILILQGKSTGRIKEDKKKILLLQQEENKLLLENYKTQLLKEQQQQLELGWWDKLKIAVASASGIAGQGAIARANSFEKSAEQIEKLAQIQKLVTDAKTRDEQLTIKLLQIEKKAADEKIKLSDNAAKLAEEAEKARIEAIERIRKGLIDTEAEERAEKLRLIKEDYNQQIALAAEFYGTNSIKILELKAAQKLAEDEQQAVFDEQDKARQDKLDEEEKNRKEKQLADDKKISDAAIKIAELEEEAKRTSLEGYAGAINSLSNTIGQETAAGKGLAVASSLINTYAAITGQLKTAASSPGGAIPGYAIAQAIATGVAGFAAVKKIVAVQVPGGGGSGSSQTGSLPTAPTPPSFNVVGASGETQLADAIGSQTQRPARAYVVSNDVTTAQEMDRNIIEGASI
jgi:hypothetical protein